MIVKIKAHLLTSSTSFSKSSASLATYVTSMSVTPDRCSRVWNDFSLAAVSLAEAGCDPAADSLAFLSLAAFDVDAWSGSNDLPNCFWCLDDSGSNTITPLRSLGPFSLGMSFVIA